jgi:hypothetical protein
LHIHARNPRQRKAFHGIGIDLLQRTVAAARLVAAECWPHVRLRVIEIRLRDGLAHQHRGGGQAKEKKF